MKSSTRCALASLLFLAVTAPAKDQPQWGRPGSRNMVSDETGLPSSFDPETGRNVKWQVPLGSQTYSTPVISQGRVLVGTNNQNPRDPRHVGDRGVLYCLNEADGSLLWQLVVPKITTSMYWDWPRAGHCSPATVEGDNVYTVSNRGEVLCLDLQGLTDGNDGPFKDEALHAAPEGNKPIPPGPHDADILWVYDMIKEVKVRQHDSAHASVLIDGPFLYVNTSNGVGDDHVALESPEAPSLIVLDKKTGRLVSRDRESIGSRIFHCTWSSPALGTVDNKRQVYFGGGDGVLYAFHALPHDGPSPAQPGTLRTAWTFDGDPRSPKTNVSEYLRNRKEGPSNIMGMPTFHDGRVYVALGGDVWWGKRKAWLQCVDAGLSGDVSGPGLVWSYAVERHCMSTPAVHEGLVYISDCGEMIHCVDAATGQAVWVHEAGSAIWSSPLVADGKVYTTTQGGDLVVLAAGRTLRLLGVTQLGEQISASPVCANGVLYITTPTTLYAVAAP